MTSHQYLTVTLNVKFCQEQLTCGPLTFLRKLQFPALLGEFPHEPFRSPSQFVDIGDRDLCLPFISYLAELYWKYENIKFYWFLATFTDVPGI